MQGTAFIYIAPVALLPALLAFWTRSPSRLLILALNALLVPLSLFLVGALFPAHTLRIPIVAAQLTLAAVVAGWLTLLHFAIRKPDAALAAVDEDVRLVPYDAAWPGNFQAERARVVDALSIPPESVEHIGSTAVADLRAKPVVDMMLGSAAWPPPPHYLSRLVILGYQNLGEAGVPARIYLRLRGVGQDFNLHVVLRGGHHWVDNLALRDYLRADPSAREIYSTAKAAALDLGGPRLLAYSAAKAAVVSRLLAKARMR